MTKDRYAALLADQRSGCPLFACSHPDMVQVVMIRAPIAWRARLKAAAVYQVGAASAWQAVVVEG